MTQMRMMLEIMVTAITLVSWTVSLVVLVPSCMTTDPLTGYMRLRKLVLSTLFVSVTMLTIGFYIDRKLKKNVLSVVSS